MDKLKVINMALMKTGLPLAASLSDCDWNASLIFDVTAEELLRGYAWNFATRLATLPEADEPPPFGFARAFILPDDCAAVIDVRSSHDLRAPRSRFTRNGSQLFTQEAPCNIRYVSASVPPEQWPPDFARACASRIAAEIASLSAEKASLAPQLIALHAKELADAQAADARESGERIPLDMSFMTARGAYREG